MQRASARAGDIVFVSGTIGDAALGLALRQPGDIPGWSISLATDQQHELRQCYLRPTPRLGLTSALHAAASAAMDISDGLVKDFERLCAAAKLGGRLYLKDIPFSPHARIVLDAVPALTPQLITHGDDYEVLCTVPPDRADTFRREAARAGIAVTAIGAVSTGQGVAVIDHTGNPLSFTRTGYDHF